MATHPALRHAALLALVALVALFPLALAAPAGAQALGAYLHSVGYTVTVWVDADDPQQVDHGRFDPTVLASDLPGCFLGRPACIRAFNRRYWAPFMDWMTWLLLRRKSAGSWQGKR